jgi:hypothetical protein
MTTPVDNFKLPPPPRLSQLTIADGQSISDTWFKYFSLLQRQVTSIVDVPTSLTLVDVSSNYTALETDDIISVFASGGPVIITLPAAPTAGHTLTIHKSDSTTNIVTIAGNGNTIENASSYHLNNPGEVVTIAYDSATGHNKWIILSKIADLAAFTLSINNATPITGLAHLNDGTDVTWNTVGNTFSPVLTTITSAGTNTKVTYDAKGRVTSSTAAVLDSADYYQQGTTNTVLRGTAGPGGSPKWGKVELTTDIAGFLPAQNSSTLHGDISKLAGNAATILATVNSNVGVFGSNVAVGRFTVNAKGLITAASNITIPNTITIDGDGNASITTGSTGSLTLATVNANVGSFGSNISVPVITVNGKGLVTAVTTQTITTGSTGVLLAETYNPAAIGGILLCSQYDPLAT